jgi:hypothetical protein
MNPEEAIEPVQLELVQGYVNRRNAGTSQVQCDLTKLQTLGAQRLESLQDFGRQRAKNLLQGLLTSLRAFGPSRFRFLGINVTLKLGMASQETNVRDFGGQHDRQQNVGMTAYERKHGAAQKGKEVPVIQEGYFKILTEMHGNAPQFYQTEEWSASPSNFRRVVNNFTLRQD